MLWYIYLYIYHVNQLNVGKSTSPIDPNDKISPTVEAISTSKVECGRFARCGTVQDGVDFLGDPVSGGMVGPLLY